MRSLKSPQSLAHAAQIGKLIHSTIKAAGESRDQERQSAALWWQQQLDRVQARLRQSER